MHSKKKFSGSFGLALLAILALALLASELRSAGEPRSAQNRSSVDVVSLR